MPDPSPEEARAELERRRSVGTFAEFVREYNVGHQLTIADYEHGETLVEVAEQVCRGYIDRLMVMMPPGYLKALADETPIMTPDGWSPISDLKVGDEVFGPDGQTTRVTAVRQWDDRPCYRATTDDGHSLVCDANHDWTVRLCRKRPNAYSVHDTEWLYERQSRMKEFRRPALPEFDALEMDESVLPIPPYSLGFWLGDGSSKQARISSGQQDRDWVKGQIRSEGLNVSEHISENNFGIVDGFRAQLRQLNLLGNKHIPPIYFRASIDQRKSLLQGLIDSDGTVNDKAHGQVTFSNTNRQLAKDTCHLVHTLGVKASLGEYRARLNGADCGPTYTVTFHYEDAARLPRKRRLCQNGTRTPHRFIEFEEAEPHDTTCISVARDDGLFLAGRSLIVTHNSTTFSQLLPAYYLHRYPRRNVGLASHTASLAWEHSDSARENYKQAGGETSTSKDAKRMWGNSHGGKMWAEGMGATITGKRYDIGVVDDPLAQQDARSKAAKKEFRQWWPGTWHNRAEPGGQMIVVMQRLAEDDPIDFLFRREVGDDTEKAPEHWTVLCLDEIKSDEPLASYDGPMGLPETCTLIEDDRELGQILAPKRYDEDEVGKHQRGSGQQADAQRQQRPSAPSGDFWKESWFKVFGDPSNAPRDDVPEGAQAHGKDWDTAYTDKERNSATVYVETARTTEDGEAVIWVYGCDWRWKEFPDLIPWMKRLDAPHYVEAKASGKSVVQTLERQDVKAEEVEVEGGDKYARANSVRGIVGSEEEGSTGRVRVHASIAQKLLLGEDQGLLRVRSEQLAEGEGDLDLNDAFVQALNRHTSDTGVTVW